MKLAIVMPAYNEEKSIGKVIEEVDRNLVDKVEIIVVDDGSQDSTSTIAKNSGATVFSNRVNKGHGFSVRKGLNLALESGADFIVTMDSDGQHSSTEINLLLEPVKLGNADVVIGTRFLNDSNLKGMRYTNKIGNYFFTKLTNKLSGQVLSDTQSGFRCLSREAVLRLNIFSDFNVTQDIILDLSYKGMVIQEVSVNVPPIREHGKSRIVRNPLDYGLRAVSIVFGTFRDHYPLRFFGFIGIPPLFFGVCSSILMLLTSLEDRSNDYLFWVNIEYTLVLLISSFFILTLGILSQMNYRNKKMIEESLYLSRKRTYKNGK